VSAKSCGIGAPNIVKLLARQRFERGVERRLGSMSDLTAYTR
jgi:hypothetical protein